MSRSRFLDKTLLAVASTVRQSLFSESYARKPRLLQRLDVRIKLLTFLAMIVCVSFLHTSWTLLFLSLLCAVLAAASGVPVPFFLKRVWLFVPLVSAVFVLPALLNVVTPGDAVLVLYTVSKPRMLGPYPIPAEIAITRQGMLAAIRFVLRVGASVSFAVLFTLTTRWSDVFRGLRALFVPRVFVVTLAMTERYLFVLLRLIQDMYRARKSRTIRPLPPAAERSWIASRIGVTFKKSLDMSEDIYKAMLSRGFRGEFRSVEAYRLSAADSVWFAAAAALAVFLLLFERGVLR